MWVSLISTVTNPFKCYVSISCIEYIKAFKRDHTCKPKEQGSKKVELEGACCKKLWKGGGKQFFIK